MIGIEMRSSTGNTIASNNNLTKDRIGAILVLVLGIGGQIFMLNPINILAPKLPMLSQQDWPRSHVDQGLMISENWQKPEGREFFIRMQITEKDRYDRKAEIEQRTTWYADPSYPAIAVANELKWYHQQPVATYPPGTSTPTSWLYCADFPFESTTWSCQYFAYWGHWYTEVKFWSEGDQYLSASEMQQLITRVNQLLMSAPDKP